MTDSYNFTNNEQMYPMGEKLKEIRAIAGLSARKLASYCDIPWDRYRSWEYQYKKPHLPVEDVDRMAAVLKSLGVPEEKIWALAGINIKDFRTKQEDTVLLSSGQLATGIKAETWNKPSSDALGRYVGPGLIIAGEITLNNETVVKACNIQKIGDRFTFEPLNEKVRDPIFYDWGPEWHQGSLRQGTSQGSARILLVIEKISELYNQNFLSNT